MANTDDLIRFLKVDMVRTGDLIHFCDAGNISAKDFNQKDGSTKKNVPTLEMEVMIGETMKKIIYSPNKTTVDLLRAAWGKDTQSWVGETGQVQIVEQISFGKLTSILVVKPLTNTDKAAKLQAQLDRAAQFRTPVPQPAVAPAGPALGQVNVWEEEDQKNKSSSLEDFNSFQTGPAK